MYMFQNNINEQDKHAVKMQYTQRDPILDRGTTL